MFATVSMVSGYLLADSFFQKACWISHFFYLCDIRIAFFKATFVGCLVSERESALGSIPVGAAGATMAGEPFAPSEDMRPSTENA